MPPAIPKTALSPSPLRGFVASVAFSQKELFKGQEVAPLLQVDAEEFKYYQFPEELGIPDSTLEHDRAKRQAPATAGIQAALVEEEAGELMLRARRDRREINNAAKSNAPDPLRADVKQNTIHILGERERRRINLVLNAAIINTTTVGGGLEWNLPGSAPIANVRTVGDLIQDASGVPQTMLSGEVSSQGFLALRNNAEIQAKYPGASSIANLTAQMVADALDIKELTVLDSSVRTSTGVARLLPDEFGLYFIDPSTSSIDGGTSATTFRWAQVKDFTVERGNDINTKTIFDDVSLLGLAIITNAASGGRIDNILS